MGVRDCKHVNFCPLFSQARYPLLGVRPRGAETERSGQRCRSRVPSGGSAKALPDPEHSKPDPVVDPDPQNMNKKFVHN